MSGDARLVARYVRPIYEAIENRQYKNAIKLCAHKRVAHLDIVQVLKAHSLERMGHAEEALDICRCIQLKQPTDEMLLNTMNLVFKLAECEHEMLPTFEHACAVSNPPNEELFQSLFVSYARCSAFLKQQQTALKMFKAFGNIKYVCWAALSMLLQVEHDGTPARMLALAEKMLLKTLRESKSDNGEALQLTVLIMQLQGNHQSALEAFDEFIKMDDDSKVKENVTLGRAAEGEGAYDEEIELGPMQAIDRLSLEAALAKNVANWTRCAAVNQKLLEDFNADDWTFLKDYIAARIEERANCSTDELLALENELTKFLNDLALRPGNERIRGPALSRILVSRAILERLQAGDTAIPKVETRLQENIVAYADQFHSKTCCFTDLKQYFTLYLKESTTVSTLAKANLINHFEKMSMESARLLKHKPTSDNLDEDAYKIGQGTLSKRLLALKTLRFLKYFDNAEHCSEENLMQLVDELEEEYEATNWLNVGSAGGQREVQLTDDLVLLAAHFLLDSYQRSSRHRLYLERAAGLLEYGLAKSAYNFQMKLLLSRVYGYMGAAEAMLSRHAELDIKYVQLDSLSFLVLDKMLDLCQYPEAQMLINRIIALHHSTAKDTPEHIARAYRLGVYSKVVDMSRFLHKRMKKSHTLAISKGEALRFELLKAFASGPARLYELVSSSSFNAQVAGLENMLVSDGAELSYNQHREVIVDWTAQQHVPTGDSFARDNAPLVECDRSADAASSVLWLKLRVLVPKLLKELADDDSTALLDLQQEYDDIVTQLHHRTSRELPLHANLWQWSSKAIAASAHLVLSHGQDKTEPADLSAALQRLQCDFTAIVDQLGANLVLRDAETWSDSVALSPYGVFTLSSLLLDAGLSSLCALALAHRKLLKKKNKKSEHVLSLASALRNLLKHMQEALSSLQTRVGALHFTSQTLSNDASSPKDRAMHKARLNVLTSHQLLQTRLVKLLQERCASIRNILQK